MRKRQSLMELNAPLKEQAAETYVRSKVADIDVKCCHDCTETTKVRLSYEIEKQVEEFIIAPVHQWLTVDVRAGVHWW